MVLVTEPDNIPDEGVDEFVSGIACSMMFKMSQFEWLTLSQRQHFDAAWLLAAVPLY
jgi:hypothetical protein